MKYIPHEYQKIAIKHILDHPAAALLLDMGLGKTVITLTAIAEMITAGIIRPPVMGPGMFLHGKAGDRRRKQRKKTVPFHL